MPRGRVANTMATFTEIPISHSAKELSLINYHQKISRAIKQIIKKRKKREGGAKGSVNEHNGYTCQNRSFSTDSGAPSYF